MDALEKNIFKLLEQEYNHRINVSLERYGYSGDFEDGLNPELLKKVSVLNVGAVRNIFENLARPKEVNIYPYDGVEEKFKGGIIVMLKFDRELGREAAMASFIYATPFPHPYKSNDLVYVSPDAAGIPIRKEHLDPADVLVQLGFDGALVSTFTSSLDGYDPEDGEEIEIDLDDPLSLDFPDPIDPDED